MTDLDSASCRSNYDLRSPTSFSDHTIFTQLSNDIRTLECSISFIEQNLTDDAVDRIPEQFEVKLVEKQTKILPKNEVIIGSPDLKANHAIHQHVEIMSENQKYNKLVKLLEDIIDGSRILIFMDTKKGCDQITRQLRVGGWPALSIHGDKSQAERDCVLSEFRAGKSPIMTATDARIFLSLSSFFGCFLGLDSLFLNAIRPRCFARLDRPCALCFLFLIIHSGFDLLSFLIDTKHRIYELWFTVFDMHVNYPRLIKPSSYSSLIYEMMRPAATVA
ncbi:uncharacterized protein LOC142520854 [Primulina tabacum]|uniref:uncharacterized protein LOC142520854 n=1 Tax=Primulina tabacum TaxID=48773 RepID=UPI003F59BC0C